MSVVGGKGARRDLVNHGGMILVSSIKAIVQTRCRRAVEEFSDAAMKMMTEKIFRTTDPEHPGSCDYYGGFDAQTVFDTEVPKGAPPPELSRPEVAKILRQPRIVS
jgi:ATP sulfurylase